MNFLATFYTHFAAQTFFRQIKAKGISGRMMPVPRSLSASCGVCVAFETGDDFNALLVEDTEKVYRIEDERYVCVFEHIDV